MVRMESSSKATFPFDLLTQKLVMADSCILFSPGRFYAATMLKLVIAHVLLNYECSLDNIAGCRSMQWRSAIIPKASVKLRIKRQRYPGSCHTKAT